MKKENTSEGFYARYGKRCFDLGAVLLALPIALPLFAIVFVAVRLLLGKPAFYLAQRPGQHARLFTLYKFRTMTDARNAGGELLPDAERMTAFGRVLRASSLDELPSLWNVIRGEMSLVGPRPLLPSYLPLYSPSQARRHEARPGITGLAQVSGRNAISWESKFAYDIAYVDNISLWLDLRIIARTIWAVLASRGISAQGEATMAEFKGTREIGEK